MEVEEAIFLPTHWGHEWQHFIQNALFRLMFALQSLPSSTYVILESSTQVSFDTVVGLFCTVD